MLADFWQVDPASPSGLSWRQAKRWCVSAPGTPACACPDRKGYFTGNLGGVSYKAHRVVFLLTYGYWPEQVDHIDGVVTNNAPTNLRAVSNAENQHNRLHFGCSFEKASRMWKATICHEGRQITLGRFSSKEEGRAAYLSAKELYHPTAPERCYV